MTRFPSHTLDTAPEASRETLAQVQKAWGFLPRLQGNLAESPLALQAYEALFALIAAKSSLSPAEQQLVFLTTSMFHACEYCAAGHTYLSRAAKMDEAVLTALRSGAALPDGRLEALRTYTLAVLRERGFVGDAAVDAVLAAGFTRAQALDVLAIIAAKTISNYANHITHTELESFMSDPSLRWVSPRNRDAA